MTTNGTSVEVYLLQAGGAGSRRTHYRRNEGGAEPCPGFARKEDAKKSIKENDGRLTNFDEAPDLALMENKY
jgi:nitrous oxide reductase accessory protein NosL